MGQWHNVQGVTCQPKGHGLGSTDKWEALQNFKQRSDRSDLNFYKEEKEGKQKCYLEWKFGLNGLLDLLRH